MSMRYVGGLVTTTVNPYAANVTTSPNYAQYNGVFTLAQQAQAATSGQWCTDPFFKNTTLLLRADGVANGSQNNTFIAANGAAQGPFADPAGYWSNSFDGSGDYLTVPGDTSLAFGSGDFTIEMWINPSVSQNKVIYDSRPTTTQGSYPCIVIDGSNIQWYIGNTITISGGSLSTNTWYHIAVCRSGTSTKMFVNGTQVGSTYTDTNVYLNGSSRPAIASSGYTLNTDVFNGYISNVRAVKGTALYTSNFTVPTTPLTAISGTSLLTCQSNVICDTSSNKFTITANGNAAVNSKSPFTISPTYNPYSFSGYFDGSGDYLSVPSNAALGFGTGDFTMEAWVYFTSNALDEFGLFGIDTTGGSIFEIYQRKLYLGCRATAYDIGASVEVPQNSWTHLAITRSSNTVTLWQNGVSVGTGTITRNYPTGTGYIGVYAPSGPAFPGYISNLRIVKGTAVYTSNFTPANEPLTAVSGTSLLTCQSSTFVDNSPNAFTITVNGNTTVATASNSGLPITRNGNTTQGTFSPYGDLWSNYFDGSGDWLSAPSNAALSLGLSDFTIEFWFYKTGTNANAPMLDWRDGGTGFLVNNHPTVDQINIYWTDTASFISTITGVQSNSWQHIAFTRSGTTFKSFLNGVLQQTTTGSYNSISSQLIIGKFSGNTSLWLDGYMSNLRIVKGTALYTTNFTPSTTPLTAISGTSLLTCQSNRFIDNSSNNFTLTVNGNTSVQRFSPFNPTAAYSASTIGGSGYFDGSGDYLSVAYNSSLDVGTSDFTYQCWFQHSAAQQANSGVFSYFNGSSYFVVHNNASSYQNLITVWVDPYSPGLRILTSTTTLVVGSWYHLAITRSSGVWRLFVNGVQESTYTNSANPVPSSSPLRIGYGNNAGFTGYISNFSVIKGTALYTSNFTPPTAPVTAITNTSLLLNFTNAGIADITTQNDLETVGNAQVSTSVVKYGSGSLAFDGSGDYLMMPNSQNFVVGTGDFTIENWVYHTTAAGSLNIYFAHQGSGISFYRNSSGKLEIAQDGVAALATSTNNIPINSWVHVAAARSGTSLKLFINGTQEASVTNSTNLTGSGSAGVGSTSTNLFPLTGYIDDLRITKGVARYISNFTPPPVALPVQ